MNNGEKQIKVVVVGAGIMGSSIAYHLSKKGIKVKVVERECIACGTTGKSSALVRTHYSNRMIAKLALYSLNVFQRFSEIGYSGFTQTGMIFPFPSRHMDVAKENVKMLREIGINEEEINPSDIKKYFPDINLDDYEYIAYEPYSGYADPVAAANSYMSAAISLGAELILGKKVKSVDSVSGGVTIYLDDGKVIRADKVILATNVWTNDILEESGVSKDKLLPIYASLHPLIYLRRPKEYQGIKPTLWDPPQVAYYKMEGETITVLGSLDPRIDETPIDIHSDIPETADESFKEEYFSKIMKRLPGMGWAGVISTFTGLYDMTPDGQVICDSLDSLGLENVYVCAGLSGHGFKLSPAYGLMASDMLVGEDPEKAMFDWRPFSLRRFSEGKLITSKYSEIGTIY